MVNVQRVSDIDPTRFVYSAPRVNHSGGQTIFVNLPEHFSKKVVIALPRCPLPFGVSDFNGRKSLQFSLPDGDEKIDEFRELLTKLDLQNVQTAVNKSVQWFKKPLLPGSIQEVYNPSMKQPSDRYPPMFRARFPTHQDTGNFMGDIFDNNKNVVRIGAITPGCQVEAIVELVGLYFVAKEFGTSWKVIQLKVYPVERIRGYSFICDSDSDSQSDAEPN
jgi:hypothetical protein